MLIMGRMQDNEAIVIQVSRGLYASQAALCEDTHHDAACVSLSVQGFERCSNYRGYGSSFAFAGECYDDSQVRPHPLRGFGEGCK